MEERDPQLSQAYRQARHPEPPTALDARILEAARQAACQTSGRSPAPRRSRWFTWAVPLSTAAVLVLGLTVLLEIQRQAPEYAARPQAIAPAGQGETADADAYAPAPLPAEPTVAVPYPVPRGGGEDDGAFMDGAPAGAPALEAGAADLRAQAEGATESLPSQAQGVTALPAAKAEAGSLPPAAPPAAAEAASNLAGRLAAPMAGAPLASANPADRESVPALSQAPAKRKAAEATADSPEQRMETIRRLLREGRLDEARNELEKLRRAYPGLALPEDLKGL